MRIRIFRRTPPINIRQGSAIKGQFAGADYDAIGMWGIVTQADSEKVTADVRLRSGVELRGLKVRSLQWSGYNVDRAFGERDLPPAGSKVFVLFPEGIGGTEDPFILCSVIDTVWEVGEKAKEELAVSGKEREALKITEQGWKVKRNKDTGDVVIENSKTGADKVTVTVNNSNGQATIESKGAKIEITSAGAINIESGDVVNIKSAAGKAINVTPGAAGNIVLNKGVQNCNNFPTCIMTGAPHGTNLQVKV